MSPVSRRVALEQVLAAEAAGRDAEVLHLTDSLSSLVAEPGEHRVHALRAESLFRLGRYAESICHLRLALDSSHLHHPADECRLARRFASLLQEIGRYADAAGFALQAFDAAERQGSEQEATMAMATIGMLCGHVAAHATGVELLTLALSRARGANDRWQTSWACNALTASLNDWLESLQGEIHTAAAIESVQRQAEMRAYQLLGYASSEVMPYARAVQTGTAAQALTLAGRLEAADEQLSAFMKLAQAGPFDLLVLRAHRLRGSWHLLRGSLPLAAIELDAMDTLQARLRHRGAAEDLAHARHTLHQLLGDEAAASRYGRLARRLRSMRERRVWALRETLTPEAVTLPERLIEIERRFRPAFSASSVCRL